MILNGEGEDKKSYRFSVKNEDTTMQVKKSGDFYNIDCKYVFNNPIPDDFVKMNIESVFYCKNESTGQLLVLDQTYQEDVILIPNRSELDYGDVKVLEFKYEVQLESGTETSKNYTHNVLADIIFNTEIDSQHLNFKLTDLSGKYTMSTSSGSGTTESHTVGFSKLSENIQFARIDITLTDPNTLELKSIFSEIIMINTIINNYDRTNMATLP